MTDNHHEQDELGLRSGPLCREPWESYYILRRGILPCCYGKTIGAPMDKWEDTWNSPELQAGRIKPLLSRIAGLSYCSASFG